VLEPDRSPLAGSVASHLDGRHPVVGALAVSGGGALVILAVLAGLGILLTQVLLDGPVGRWDLEVVTSLAENRSPTWDTLSRIGSGLADTLTVVALGSIVASVLIIRRWAQGAVLLAAALFTEVTVFLLTALLVPRDRPPEALRLDPAPPTSSFPSGHTAASIAIYVGLAIIGCALVRSRVVRSLIIAVAALVPVAVGLSRMYRGMHYPTDVLAGVLLGVSAVLVGVLAARTALLLARQRAANGSPGRDRDRT
jgi:undecaprenyl-diphosphatase